MSLATRCPACGTVFRVVQDQLRVSEGWVRCGRCSEVFNGADHLVELDRPPGEPAAPPAPTPEPPASDAPSPPQVPTEAQPSIGPDIVVGDETVSAMEQEPVIAVAEPGAALREALPEPEPGPGAAPEPAASREPAARAEPDIILGEAVADPVLAAAPGVESGVPSFVRAAEEQERRRRPGLRRAWAWAGLFAGLLLLLQVAVEYRDLIAARWPASRSVLESLCRWSGCRIEAPRWIDALAVDSSGLIRVEGTQTYRLSVVLRNRAAMELAMPAVDLSLTDTQGRVVARRTLGASDLGAQARVVGSLAEVPLQATLAVAERNVAGYTIEIFYP